MENFVHNAIGIVAGIVILLSSFVSHVPAQISNYLNQFSYKPTHVAQNTKQVPPNPRPSVLAATVDKSVTGVSFNIPAFFNDIVSLGKSLEVAGESTFNGPVTLTNQNLDLGTGELTAGNVLYSLTAGDNITITGTQDLTISAKNSGVTSLGGSTGALSLAAGSGVTVSGLTVTNSDKGSSQSIFKTISVSGQSDISASSNTDTLTFVAGAGVAITTDATNKKVTITGTSDPGWTDDGTVVRLSTITDLIGIGTTSPLAKLNVLATTEQLRLSYDVSNYTAFTVSSGGNLTLAPSGGTTAITGALTTSGAVTLGDTTGDDITFTGRLANGTSIVPNTDLGSDLGASSLRFNNLWVANINSNSSQSFSGQTTFSYAPTDSTVSQASVLINPTTSVANGQLLAFALAGYEKALIDVEGDLILGYNDQTSAPATSYPLNVYGHSGTRVAYVDTSGNMNISGTLTPVNIGIGTTSPNAQINIVSTDTTGSTSTISFKTNDTNNFPRFSIDTNGDVSIISGNTNFGTGLDGSINVSASKNINTTSIIANRSCADGGDAVNYSASSLTASTATLSSTPSSGCLAVGDEILLINLQGTSTNYGNVGNYETMRIQSISGTTITFAGSKTKYYGDTTDSDDTNIGTATTNQRVMLQRIPQYTNVTVQSGGTITASAWNGTKGGVLFFRSSGIVNVKSGGSISGNSLGYRGGSDNNPAPAYQGESYNATGSLSTSANLGGGGGGTSNGAQGGSGGGGYGTAGSNGSANPGLG